MITDKAGGNGKPEEADGRGKFLREAAGRRLTLFAAGMILFAAAALLCAAAYTQKGMEKYRIAMIVKSTESDFFQSVFSGANVAATEYNAALTTQGAETEEDYFEQNRMIDKAVSDGADALVISAVDYQENAAAVDRASEAGLQIVVIDSDVDSAAVKCRIGTDNYAFGRMAAQAIKEQMGEQELRIGIVNFDENTANGQERETGFREEIGNIAEPASVDTINVLSTTEDARAGTKKLLAQHPDINVIVTFNEWTSLGVGWAIRDLSCGDEVMVVACDSNTVSVGMLEAGEVDALIVQNPYAMGYLGVEAACRLLAGKKVDARIDTATTLVTRETMYLPEYQKILFRYK